MNFYTKTPSLISLALAYYVLQCATEQMKTWQKQSNFPSLTFPPSSQREIDMKIINDLKSNDNRKD